MILCKGGLDMNILAVDDEELPLRLLVDSISKAIPSAEIHSFQDPNEALEHLSTNQCDIAFLDIEMRGMTGLEFSRKLKATPHKDHLLDFARVLLASFPSSCTIRPSKASALRRPHCTI